MPTKALLSFLFASFLLYPLVRAAETESKPAPAAKPAKSAAKPKAKPKPKLKKVKWLWGQSSVKSQMASLDASLKDQQGKNDQLEVQVRETRSRIARLEGKPAADLSLFDPGRFARGAAKAHDEGPDAE